MKASKAGLISFWIGAAYMIIAGWLIMWWVAPTWARTPPEQFEGTAMAFAGPVFNFIALSTPVVLLLVVIGMLLYAGPRRLLSRPFVLPALGIILVALTVMFPTTMGYYPAVFGILGGLIMALFLGAVWVWARRRPDLEGEARTAADLQMVSWVFFFLAANLSCALLGNPFSGLYFPEKLLESGALAWHYSTGTKIALYFALGLLFTFLSQYVLRKAESNEDRQYAV